MFEEDQLHEMSASSTWKQALQPVLECVWQRQIPCGRREGRPVDRTETMDECKQKRPNFTIIKFRGLILIIKNLRCQSLELCKFEGLIFTIESLGVQ